MWPYIWFRNLGKNERWKIWPAETKKIFSQLIIWNDRWSWSNITTVGLPIYSKFFLFIISFKALFDYSLIKVQWRSGYLCERQIKTKWTAIRWPIQYIFFWFHNFLFCLLLIRHATCIWPAAGLASSWPTTNFFINLIMLPSVQSSTLLVKSGPNRLRIARNQKHVKPFIRLFTRNEEHLRLPFNSFSLHLVFQFFVFESFLIAVHLFK